jgi:hypothetical protein
MSVTSNYTDTCGAAQHLRCSVSFLQKARIAGGGPRFLKLGKAVRYRIEDLDDWACARAHGSTSEYPARFAKGHAVGGAN